MTSSPRERIATVQAAYIRCISNDRLEDWPAFFTEHCHYIVTTAQNLREGLPAGLIWADSRAMLEDRVAALRKANIYERQAYRHLIGQPFVTAESAETASAETPFMVARIMQDGSTDLFCTGVYLDEFDLTAPQGLIRSRRVVCDSNRIDTLLAIPL
jgi:anthranilate 1,2-dioxygenase small subunit